MNDTERAVRLIVERWVEQLETSFVPRRSRTLSPIAAMDELFGLADGYLRSGGVTRPAVEADEGGHGIAMLPDVALEACELVRADVLLGEKHAARRDSLTEIIGAVKTKADVTAERLSTMRALVEPLRASWLSASFALMLELAATAERIKLVQLTDTTLSELRASGWSDEALLDAARRVTPEIAGDPVAALRKLCASVSTPVRPFRCFVAVSVPKERPPFPEGEQDFAFVEELPGPVQGRPMKRGPYASVLVDAYDAYAAAGHAHRRVLSTIGALTVFLRELPVDVASEVVAVEQDGGLVSVEVENRLVEEKRRTSRDEQAHILRSAWSASGKRSGDPLHDALRLRHRALTANDADSRLLLLWSSVERMTAGADGYGSALSASRELVSHAITLGKLRRDVGDLAATIERTLSVDPSRHAAFLSLTTTDGKPRADRTRVLELLCAEKTVFEQLTALIYDKHPLLAQRCHDLRTAVGAQRGNLRGTALAKYFETSRRRVSWQVARIYRARNRVAHVGDGADRVRDLVWHAHFYLTQLIAICIHYSTEKPASPQSILLGRVGHYKAFILLLSKNDPAAMTPATLLRPTSLLESAATP